MEYRSVSVVAPPRPTKRPPDAEALDALIEEARRRTRRRRRRFGACVLLVGMAGAVAFVGLRGESGPVPPAAEPMPRLEPVVGPPALKNGPLTIAAVEANGRHEGPSGWYGLSTVRRDGRLETLVRCPNRVRWCGEVESIDWSPDGRRLALSASSVGVANPYNGIHVV